MQVKSFFSWKLISNFNQLPSLFIGQNLPYQIETYVCGCSFTKMLCKHQNEASNYTCEVCENSFFEDANVLLKESTWFSKVDTIFPQMILETIKPRMHTNPVSQEITLYIAIDIPAHIDYLREKVYFIEKKLFEITLHKDGTLIQKPLVYFGLNDLYKNEEPQYYNYTDETDESHLKQNELLILYSNKMLNLLKTHPSIQENTLLMQCQSIEEINFFVKYPHLKEITFTKWLYPELLPHTPLDMKEALLWVANYRPEKSFKKAIFNRYDLCIKLGKPFNHLLIRTLALYMRDVNCAKTLVHLDLDINQNFRNTVYCERLWKIFFIFLTSRFSDIHISRLLRQFAKIERFWLIDSMEILDEIWHSNIREEHRFEPIPDIRCNAMALHDTLHLYYREHIRQSNQECYFSYEAYELAPCVDTESLSVRVPKNALDLHLWADTMHNCLAGYTKRILSKESLIYGFFEGKRLVFVVELQHNRIIQARSKCNHDLISRHNDFLRAWYKRFFSKSEMNNLLSC